MANEEDRSLDLLPFLTILHEVEGEAGELEGKEESTLDDAAAEWTAVQQQYLLESIGDTIVIRQLPSQGLSSVYYEHLFDPLLRTLEVFMRGEVAFLMAHLKRWKKRESVFFRKARKLFEVSVLHTDPPLPDCRNGVAKQNAVCAILRMLIAEENRAGIGVSGAISALVALLRGGTSRGKKDALTELYKLCSGEQRNKELAVAARAVARLGALVAERGRGMMEKAAVVVGSLATAAEGREAIVEKGGIESLVEVVEEGSARGKFIIFFLKKVVADALKHREYLIMPTF